jgi:methionine-rich copper-binding protein CopC
MAHDDITNSSPEAGAVARSPEEIVLTFSSKVSSDACSVTLSSAVGERFSIRPTSSQKGEIVRFKVGRTLGAGLWTVEWRVLSSDGHPAAGVYSFTVEGDASQAVNTSAVTSTSEAQSPGAPIGVLIALILALVVGAGAGVFYYRREQTK